MHRVALILAMLVASAGVAEARCADELGDFQARLQRMAKSKPTPQTAAAAKVLKRYNEEAKQSDEVECYNTLARARRALNAPDDKPKVVNGVPLQR